MKITRKVAMLIGIIIIVSTLFIGSVLAAEAAGTSLVEEWKAILERVVNTLDSFNSPHT